MLSLFPGLGVLGKAFEKAGWCVVRGPDVIWGGDVRDFNPPPGHFHGVIGGPPCQSFSALAPLSSTLGSMSRFVGSPWRRPIIETARNTRIAGMGLPLRT